MPAVVPTNGPMTTVPTQPLSGAPSSGVWASVPLSERLGWLTRFRRLVAAHQQELCQLMEDEVRKPLHEGLMADVVALLAHCKWLEKHAERLLRERVLGDAPFWMAGTRVVERRVPLGRVGIIATWNYPVQLLGIQLIQALVAGNSVVVKPSERAPRTQQRLLELAVRAGLPHGTLVWVGSAREAGANMLATQRFDHVIFTGSTEVGQRIAQTLAKTLTPCTLELSGRDSVLVLEDADPKRAAKAVWAAVKMNAGQTCMGPRRVLVHAKVYDAFARHMAKLAGEAQPTDLIDEASAQKCRELVVRAVSSGARDAGAAESGPLGSSDILQDLPSQRRFKPTVLLHCTPGMDVVEGRHFGPLCAVVRVAALEEALEIHRRCDQHLTCAVFTKNPRAVLDMADRLGATNVMINDIILPASHPAASIGGRGPSGAGLSRGEEGLLGLTRAIYVSTSRGGIAQLVKTPTPWQTRMLARFLRWWYEGHRAPPPPKPVSLPRSAAGVAPADEGPLPLADEGPQHPTVHRDRLFSQDGLGEAYTGRKIQ